VKELARCPFCGGNGALESLSSWNNAWPTESKHWVECRQCYAQIDEHYDTEEEAIAAWNTRADGWVKCSDMNPSGWLFGWGWNASEPNSIFPAEWKDGHWISANCKHEINAPDQFLDLGKTPNIPLPNAPREDADV
jgi:Lar family restriction alleviation protein